MKFTLTLFVFCLFQFSIAGANLSLDMINEQQRQQPQTLEEGLQRCQASSETVVGALNCDAAVRAQFQDQQTSIVQVDGGDKCSLIGNPSGADACQKARDDKKKKKPIVKVEDEKCSLIGSSDGNDACKKARDKRKTVPKKPNPIGGGDSGVSSSSAGVTQ